MVLVWLLLLLLLNQLTKFVLRTSLDEVGKSVVLPLTFVLLTDVVGDGCGV